MGKNTIKISGKNVIASIELVIYEEDGFHIAFAPAIDLSSYGNSLDNALEEFKVAISVYFDYTLKKSTLEKDLLALGWKIEKRRSRRFIPPTLDELKKKNNYIGHIMNQPNLIRQQISVPS